MGGVGEEPLKDGVGEGGDLGGNEFTVGTVRVELAAEGIRGLVLMIGDGLVSASGDEGDIEGTV